MMDEAKNNALRSAISCINAGRPGKAIILIEKAIQAAPQPPEDREDTPDILKQFSYLHLSIQSLANPALEGPRRVRAQADRFAESLRTFAGVKAKGAGEDTREGLDAAGMKSCPFCGQRGATMSLPVWRVGCWSAKCLAFVSGTARGYASEAEAIAAWNHRPRLANPGEPCDPSPPLTEGEGEA
jgi:hypothetical protein